MLNIFNKLKTAPEVERIEDPEEIKKLYRYWRVRILYSMYVGYATFYFTRKSFYFVMPEIISELHITHASQLGILGTGFYITYGLSKFIHGMASDKSNPRYFMTIGLIITGIANILFGFCSSVPMLAFFWILNGWFQGWGWPPCVRLLTKWYSEKERGRWWSIWNTSHNLGGASIPLLSTGIVYGVHYLADTFGWENVGHWAWRFAMFTPGVISILMGLFALNRLRDIPITVGLPPIDEYHNDPESASSDDIQKTPITEIFVKYVLYNKYIWALALASSMVYMIRMSFYDWGVLYLRGVVGLKPFQAGSCITFLEIGGFTGNLVAGWGSDLISKGNRGPINAIFCFGILIVSTLLALLHIGYLPLPSSHLYLFYAISFAMLGFFIFGPQMLIGMAAAELSHKDAAGTSTGFIGIFSYVGAALAGAPVGLLIGKIDPAKNLFGDWNNFFMAMAIASFIAAIILALLWSVQSAKIRSHQ